jgi:hypothetical protein
VKYSTSLALFAFSAFLVPVAAISASSEVSLTQAAAQLGYGYAYLGPEDAVQLSRPGLIIVVRPGEKLIDVNDRTEAMDAAPVFMKDDLFVTSSFVLRLRELASRFPTTAAPPSIEAPVVIVGPRVGETVHGGTISLNVRQLPGSQSLAISGSAPPSAPITVTIKETFWDEVPDVVLNRDDVDADNDGHFEAIVPVAPGYFRGGIITVVASSLPGVTTASAKIVLRPPNNGVVVPAQQIPKSIR